MAFYFDVIIKSFVIACLGLAFLLKANGTNEALIALCLTSVLQLFGPFQHVVSTGTEIEN